MLKKGQKRPKSVQRFGLEDFTTTRDITQGQNRPKIVKKKCKNSTVKWVIVQIGPKKTQKRAKMHPKVPDSIPRGQK